MTHNHPRGDMRPEGNCPQCDRNRRRTNQVTISLNSSDLALLRGAISQSYDLYNQPAQRGLDDLDKRLEALQRTLKEIKP